MQVKTMSARIVIEGSEPELSILLPEDPDLLTNVETFRSEITKWVAGHARGRVFDAKSASNELLRWSREYFGSVDNRLDGVRDDTGQSALGGRAA